MPTINGSAGADTLIGTNGNDTVNGLGGDDQINERRLVPSDPRSGGNDIYDGGDGYDTLAYGLYLETGVVVDLRRTNVQDTGGGGRDRILNVENVTGTQYADALTGNGANNALLGGAGADALSGLDGQDFLQGGEGADTLFGGDGNDSLDDATLGFASSVFGGDDILDGGRGNDTLRGGDGADTLIGGEGDDTLYADDFYDQDAARDVASYVDARAGVRVDLRLMGVAQDTGITGRDVLNGIEDLTGGAFRDTLLGDARGNILEGGAASDTLQGFEGDDTVLGGDGVDHLLGSIGNDRLVGGAGRDILTGGDDRDTFVLGARDDSPITAFDIITDFERRVDILDLSAVDADATMAGDQAFRIVAGFTGVAGDLILRSNVNGGTLLGDTDGDGAADFALRLEGAFILPLASDIVL